MGEALVGRPYKFVESSLSVAQIPKRKIMYNNLKDLVGSTEFDHIKGTQYCYFYSYLIMHKAKLFYKVVEVLVAGIDMRFSSNLH